MCKERKGRGNRCKRGNEREREGKKKRDFQDHTN